MTIYGGLLRLIIAGGIVFLFFVAINSYEGSSVVFALFSTAFLALLGSGFYRQRTYGYTFLAVFLWLGFWLKVSWHLAWGNGYPEPTGQFMGSPAHWDSALIVSTIGALAVLSARLLFETFFGGAAKTLYGGKDEPPQWLKPLWRWHWALFLLVVVAVAAANFYFQIFVVGLKVGTILAWPLNALITLMLAGGGFAAWMAVLLWCEIRWTGAVFRWVILLIMAALVITMSSLSRGMIVMLLVPGAYALYKNSHGLLDLSRKRLGILLILLFCAVTANFYAVNEMRNSIYFEKKAEVAKVGGEQQKFSMLRLLMKAKEQAIGLMHFSVDRWVGIEGVMAVSSYPELGADLWARAMLEPPVKTEPSIYATIAPWRYEPSVVMHENVNFMSLPGGMAFFYYSGSLWVVFAVTIFSVLAIQYFEMLIYKLTSNPLLCAHISWLMALTFAHFGGAPKSQLPTLLFSLMLVLLVGALQAKWLASLVNRVCVRA